MKGQTQIKNGSSAAAILAAGIGLAAVGIMTVTAENIAAGADSKALTWSKEVGNLTGETILGLIGWIVAWVLLGFFWKDKEVKLPSVLFVTIILAVVGLLTTFPPFFDLFSKH